MAQELQRTISAQEFRIFRAWRHELAPALRRIEDEYPVLHGEISWGLTSIERQAGKIDSPARLWQVNERVIIPLRRLALYVRLRESGIPAGKALRQARNRAAGYLPPADTDVVSAGLVGDWELAEAYECLGGLTSR